MMLRFLLGLILLPFAIFGLLFSVVTIARVINAFNHHAPPQPAATAAPQRGRINSSL